jgi:pyruvate,water dikinase
MSEFEQLQQGDVLVIPFSDISWTPLFSKAGAVIAESGGILSHSSIVAREYQIPAVVSVPGAIRLTEGMVVTVDGYRGEIIAHTQDSPLSAAL